MPFLRGTQWPSKSLLHSERARGGRQWEVKKPRGNNDIPIEAPDTDWILDAKLILRLALPMTKIFFFFNVIYSHDSVKPRQKRFMNPILESCIHESFIAVHLCYQLGNEKLNFNKSSQFDILVGYVFG